MAQVKFAYGTKAKIDSTPVTNGTLYICSDKKTLYADIGNKRIIIGEIPTLGTAASRGVDTTITDNATSKNLPTTEAVKNFVNAKNVTPEIVYSSTQPTDDNVKIWIQP